MSKYPPFERVKVGRLRVGDRYLKREGNQDNVALDGHDDVHWTERPTLPAGVHTITAFSASQRRVGRRMSRYYHLTFDTGHKITLASVNVVNRVLP